MPQKYFEIDDDSVDWIRPTEQWLNRAKGNVLCTECGSVLPGVGSIDVKLSKKPEPTPTLLIQPSIGAFDISLLETLGMDDVRAHVHLGKVINPDGSCNSQYATVLAREQIMFRGKADSNHHVCPHCGRLLYTSVRSRYIMNWTVASQAPIYGEESVSLLVCESIRDKIAAAWGKRLKLYKVPVAAKARDGLDDDLGLWPTPAQLKRYMPHVWAIKT